MPDDGVELRSISWSRAFPFVSLFRTFRLAGLHAGRLLLGLMCVLTCYVGGRVLDALWPAANKVTVQVVGHEIHTEVEAYVSYDSAGLAAWLKTAAEQNRRFAETTAAMAQAEESTNELAQARQLVETRLTAGLAALISKQELTAEQRAEQRRRLYEAADTLRLTLAGCEQMRFAPSSEREVALGLIAGADPNLDPAQRPADEALLRNVITRERALAELDRRQPRGPFITMLQFEARCLAAAVQGVCAGNWGFAGSALSEEPALLSSIAGAGRGVVWLITQRPWFALIYGLVVLLACSYFGGAVCRSAAVQSARDESLSLGRSLGFACQKYAQFVTAPLLPLSIFVGCAVLIFLGSLLGALGAIPVIGAVFEFLAGLFFVLALLGGFALALILLATMLGFNLLWPTIAVEGSDSFDALSRAASYVGERPWHAGFYAMVLLLYGGVCLVLVRLIALLLLKLTHVFCGAGMGVFGWVTSDNTSTIGRLDAIWRMPAWSDLPLLPSTGPIPFWGTFANAPLSAGESLAFGLIAFWVFMVVGLVGAFVVNFFFCGSVQMYYLLRREVDATDSTEIFYEETEDAELTESEPPTEESDAGATDGAQNAPEDDSSTASGDSQ